MKKILMVIVLLFSSLNADPWSTPVDIDIPGSSFQSEGVLPQIKVDALGNAYAAWGATDGGNNVIKAAIYDANTETWGAPVIIGSDNAENAVLGVTTDGKAIVLWDKASPGGSQIFYSAYVSGTWTAEAQVAPLDPDGQIHARVGVDNLNPAHAVAVWTEQPGPFGQVIRGATYHFDTNIWDTYTNVSVDYSPNSYVGQPDIAVNASGQAVAVWRYNDGGATVSPYRIQSNTYTNGAGWSSPQDAATNTTEQLIIPQVGISNSGVAIANWLRIDNALHNYTVEASVLSGGIWSAPIALSATGYVNTINPEKWLPFFSIGFDANGDAIDLWNYWDESLPTPIYQAQASTYQNGIWSPAVTISNTSLFGVFPQVAVKNNGDAIAVFMQGATFLVPPIEAVSTEYSKSNDTWGPINTISTTTPTGFFPNVGTNGNASTFAVWVNFLSGKTVQSAQFIGSVTPPTSLTGFQNTNRFPVESELYNELLWTPSSSPDIVSYQIYRNGILIATVPFTTFSYQDHNRVPGVQYTYGVAAVDSNGNVSAQIIVVIS